MKIYSMILAVLVGFAIAIQAPINSVLAKTVTTKISVLNNFLIGTIIIVFINLFSKNFHNYKNIVKVSPVYWIGGILGIIIVFLSIKVVSNLGAGVSMAIFVAVELITGVVIDYFGLFGLDKQPITSAKIFGIVMLLIGVKMIIK